MYSTPDVASRKRLHPAHGAAMRLLGAGVWILAAVLCGCSADGAPPLTERVPRSLPQQLSSAPLLVDRAMELRDWSPSVAYYANGSVPAGPTDFFYRPSSALPDWLAGDLVDPLLFTIQAVALPIEVVVAPPWQTVVWHGATFEPSYTAQPVLPER